MHSSVTPRHAHRLAQRVTDQGHACRVRGKVDAQHDLHASSHPAPVTRQCSRSDHPTTWACDQVRGGWSSIRGSSLPLLTTAG
jgi:hypothetical protein